MLFYILLILKSELSQQLRQLTSKIQMSNTGKCIDVLLLTIYDINQVLSRYNILSLH